MNREDWDVIDWIGAVAVALVIGGVVVIAAAQGGSWLGWWGR